MYRNLSYWVSGFRRLRSAVLPGCFLTAVLLGTGCTAPNPSSTTTTTTQPLPPVVVVEISSDWWGGIRYTYQDATKGLTTYASGGVGGGVLITPASRTTVTLEALPGQDLGYPDSEFVEWAPGPCAGQGAICSFQFDGQYVEAIARFGPA